MSIYIFPFDLKRFHLKNFIIKNTFKKRWLVMKNSVLPKGRKEKLKAARRSSISPETAGSV